MASTARRLLRPRWDVLLDRLWANRVTAQLYSLGIISDMDMDQIEDTAARSRSRGARELLNIMKTRTWNDGVRFASILSHTEGIQDLGERLLQDAAAGRRNYGHTGTPNVLF